MIARPAKGPDRKIRGGDRDERRNRREDVCAIRRFRTKGPYRRRHVRRDVRPLDQGPRRLLGEHGKRIDWIKPYTKVKNTDFTYGQVDIKWFEDGTLNVAANCIDRHLKDRGDQTAIIWVPDEDDGSDQHISYNQLASHVGKFANVLKEMGVEKGDRVVIYLPMIPQAAYAMLACARIGAIHSVVFAGFSPEALSSRINGSKAKVVITSDGSPRGGRVTPLKQNADKAFEKVEHDAKMLVVKRAGNDINWEDGRDHWLHEMEDGVSDSCPAEEMNAEDPLFILYTSGSTGQPKGVVHSTGGYIVYTSMTHEYTFDYHDGDVYWCTADVGWVTGHSYIVYGPLANGATTLMFEGVPTYPDAGRFWKILRRPQGQPVLHCPYRHPRADGQGERAGRKARPVVAETAGHCGRADQPRGVALVQRRRRQGELSHCRHVVADRNRRPHADPLPGATPTKPGSATKLLLRHPARRAEC